MKHLPRFAPLLLPFAALSLPAAEPPQPAPAAHMEIAAATREKLDLSLHNDSKTDLSFYKPWPSAVCCSIIARTSDGVLHAYRFLNPHLYGETAPEKKATGKVIMQPPSFLTVKAGENQSSVLPLNAGDWPDLFEDWPRMNGLAFCYFNPHRQYTDQQFNSKGLFPPAATSASCKLFPLPTESGATVREESKVRIEIESISKKEIALLIRNDSDRKVSVFKTGYSWGDDSFFLIAEMKDGSFQRFDCELGGYTINSPDTLTIPAHQTGKETLGLSDRSWVPLLAAWDQIQALSACYGDGQFRDDPALKASDSGNFHQHAIVTWPHSIGGVPKAMPDAEPQPAVAAHVEITSATKQQLAFSLSNDSKEKLSFSRPWPSGSCCSVIAHTSDGLLHAYRYQAPASGRKTATSAVAQEPPFFTMEAGEKQVTSLQLDASAWPDLLAAWPQFDGVAFSYFEARAGSFNHAGNPKAISPPAAISASCKLFPLTPEPGATAPEESKVRIEIASISKKEIALLIRNDSDREVSVFRTANSWGDDSFFLIAEMKDGSFQRFDCELGDYTKNAPDTWTIPAHQTGKETLRLFDRNWRPLLAAWDQIHALSACYGDRQFRDDRALNAYDDRDYHEDAIVTWPHSIGGVPKVLTNAQAAPKKK